MKVLFRVGRVMSAVGCRRVRYGHLLSVSGPGASPRRVAGRKVPARSPAPGGSSPPFHKSPPSSCMEAVSLPESLTRFLVEADFDRASSMTGFILRLSSASETYLPFFPHSAHRKLIMRSLRDRAFRVPFSPTIVFAV